MSTAVSYSVPGIYHRPSQRQASFSRVRTDIVGFVGITGAARHLHKAVAVNDWQSYVDAFHRDERGREIAVPPGSQLDQSVKDFFANGGARCWVVTCANDIRNLDSDKLSALMLGYDDLDQHHGLELLLRQEEVSIVVLPELDAEIVPDRLPSAAISIDGPPCFVTCTQIAEQIMLENLAGPYLSSERFFTDQEVLQCQRYLLTRLQRESWRWFALLAPPPDKSELAAKKWHDQLVQHNPECYHAALYWPWVYSQTAPGSSIQLRSPVGFMAGVFARRDLAKGPHSAPANEVLTSVVGLQQEVSEKTIENLYDHGINVIRSLPGRGVRIWGARTLSWSRDTRNEALGYINARRCLTAIERTAERLGQQIVFQPNTPILRLQIFQTLVSYLSKVYESGALLGDDEQSAFFVRCDGTNNPAENVEQGLLVCEVGVALAKPAEFIVFRIGRREGLSEIEELNA
ncbi:phage tail sheath family protein [Teredinibacter sp. KSP-S5-2]|uniref:phage tail sheath family protein n=1 Tax=Teredinibacter sp. KSP-S5-2 TaxID=3034506 RepID=UPI002934116D|nr:phage tail sheath subtilisin-like domain-containing protein [Teredinibacter sp. KSP-S5-2]WNO11500.1 phage tail sheath subtilisin-like domain-containing protein [Teredinibacter sp. KSP-S5-2]